MAGQQREEVNALIARHAALAGYDPYANQYITTSTRGPGSGNSGNRCFDDEENVSNPTDNYGEQPIEVKPMDDEYDSYDFGGGGDYWEDDTQADFGFELSDDGYDAYDYQGGGDDGYDAYDYQEVVDDSGGYVDDGFGDIDLVIDEPSSVDDNYDPYDYQNVPGTPSADDNYDPYDYQNVPGETAPPVGYHDPVYDETGGQGTADAPNSSTGYHDPYYDPSGGQGSANAGGGYNPTSPVTAAPRPGGGSSSGGGGGGGLPINPKPAPVATPAPSPRPPATAAPRPATSPTAAPRPTTAPAPATPRNDGTAVVRNPSTGAQQVVKLPIGQAIALATGELIRNNGNGTYTIQGQNGAVQTRSYAAGVANAPTYQGTFPTGPDPKTMMIGAAGLAIAFLLLKR